jgi:hypothetical protein
MAFCARAIFWRWRSAASAPDALSLVDFSAATRCCSGVGGLLMTSCICMHLLMPNITAEKARFDLADINTWHVAAQENCNGNITTETRAASLSCYDAHKLDNGVAGMEDLSGSKDLSKSLKSVTLWFATYYRQSTNNGTKMAGTSLRITSKLCLHSNLQTLRQLALQLPQ